MLLFHRPFTDPYFNLAAEEYFVKHSSEDICMIWINEKSVIIGKHQNAYAEINYPYVRDNNIPVIRRISGGGAVYHDTGNVNFTFICKTGKTNQVDFGQFTSVIVGFMKSLGLDVNISKRNSLFIGNQKFSGHAEHIFHDKVLHHGTILYNTDLDALRLSILPGPEYKGKAMASVRSEVANIASLLPGIADIHQFIEKMLAWLMDFYPDSRSYEMKADEVAAIQELAESRYKIWQWNFGYSPAYSFQVDIQVLSSDMPIEIKVGNGKIVQIEVPPEAGNTLLYATLSNLIGILHKKEEIDTFVQNNRHSLELAGVNTVTFGETFFK